MFRVSDYKKQIEFISSVINFENIKDSKKNPTIFGKKSNLDFETYYCL